MASLSAVARGPQTICQRRDSTFSDQIHEWRKTHHQLLVLGEHPGRLRARGRSTGLGVKSLAPAPTHVFLGKSVPFCGPLWKEGLGLFFLRLFLVLVPCLREPQTAPAPLLQGLLSHSLYVTLFRTKFIPPSIRSIRVLPAPEPLRGLPVGESYVCPD